MKGVTFPPYFQVTLKGKELFRVCTPVDDNLTVLFIALAKALSRPGTSTPVFLRVLSHNVRSLATMIEKPCGETTPQRKRGPETTWGESSPSSLVSQVSPAFQPSLPK